MTSNSASLPRGRHRLTTVSIGLLLGIPAAVAGVIAGIGWLYVLRGLGWLSVGPSIPDSLPLLQLAGLDGQPLARVIVAWIPCGALVGALMPRVRWPWRGLLTLAVGLPLLLLAAQLSFALARNLRVSEVLWSHPPGLGPWLEGLLLVAGSLVPSIVVAGWVRIRRAR